MEILQTDLITGFLLGHFLPPPRPFDFLRIGIGIAIIATVVIIAILLCKDLGPLAIGDTAKFLWAMSFFLLPIVSWVAYLSVIKKGKSITKSNK